MSLTFLQVTKRNEELRELQMKVELLEGERLKSGEELIEKREVLRKLNEELSTFRAQVTNLTQENEVLEVKVRRNLHLFSIIPGIYY